MNTGIKMVIFRAQAAKMYQNEQVKIKRAIVPNPTLGGAKVPPNFKL